MVANLLTQFMHRNIFMVYVTKHIFLATNYFDLRELKQTKKVKRKNYKAHQFYRKLMSLFRSSLLPLLLLSDL